MPEFRTIEEFVLLLESWRGQAIGIGDGSVGGNAYAKGHSEGMTCAVDRVLNVVRNSNIGIVYSPEGK